jgi:hypothetical protein
MPATVLSSLVLYLLLAPAASDFQLLHISFAQPRYPSSHPSMQYSTAALFAAFAAANVLTHEVITEIQGANGVNMPALSGKRTCLISHSPC